MYPAYVQTSCERNFCDSACTDRVLAKSTPKGARMPDPKKEQDDSYESPKVEQIETEDQPAVTAAGATSGTTTTPRGEGRQQELSVTAPAGIGSRPNALEGSQHVRSKEAAGRFVRVAEG